VTEKCVKANSHTAVICNAYAALHARLSALALALDVVWPVVGGRVHKILCFCTGKRNITHTHQR